MRSTTAPPAIISPVITANARCPMNRQRCRARRTQSHIGAHALDEGNIRGAIHSEVSAICVRFRTIGACSEQQRKRGDRSNARGDVRARWPTASRAANCAGPAPILMYKDCRDIASPAGARSEMRRPVQCRDDLATDCDLFQMVAAFRPIVPAESHPQISLLASNSNAAVRSTGTATAPGRRARR
jgi:hypothetical protein